MSRKVMTLALWAGLSAVLQGCYSENCLESATCAESITVADASCDPASGGVRADCPGVFVSSSIGSDDGLGSRDRPVRTLSMAINAARTGPRRVYACAETFTEAVIIPAGLELWGGLDCAGGWAYVGESPKTVIIAESDAIPVRFVAGAGRAVIADVRAEAAHSTQPSGSSIAVIIGPGTAADIVRSELIARDGAPGADGSPGGTLPAPSGAPGASGAPACTASTVSGGAGAFNSCRGYDSIGGTGGIGAAFEGGDGTDGTPEPYPNTSDAGRGGAGAAGAAVCGDGVAGAEGAHGLEGSGAVHTWGISELGWTGAAGQDGGDGLPGQGGGGGGGSRAGAACGPNLGGASGGGGGAGGCGGAGGKGGGAGGASIGVLSLSGDVTLLATSIRTGRGGDGGKGGPGQSRGTGGQRGDGGSGDNNSPPGCFGGNGGSGGNGGNGGGGLGGPSIGILYPFGNTPLHDADIRTREAGKGGLGGDPSIPGSAGLDGARADTLGVPPQ